jgi:hypothetical protein
MFICLTKSQLRIAHSRQQLLRDFVSENRALFF